MSCVVALTLAVTAGATEAAPAVLVNRETSSARGPLAYETADRPAVRAVVTASGPRTYFVKETPREVMLSKPCEADPR